MRILHASDLHLDAPTYRGLVDSTPGCWRAVCTIAAERQVDALLVAGDAFDVRDPDRRTLNAFQSGLDIAREAGVPVVLLTGNHDGDPLAEPDSTALEPFGRQPGVYVSTRPEVLTVGDRRIATLPWVSRARLMALNGDMTRHDGELAVMDGLLRLVADLRRQGADVLMGHWTVEGGVSGTERDLSAMGVPALASPELAGFAYLAFGHLHRHQPIGGQDVWGAYSGSIDRVDFGEERDEKVCLEVDLSARTITANPLPARLLRTIEFVVFGSPATPDYRGHEDEVAGAIVRITGPNLGHLTDDIARTLRENGAAHVLDQTEPDRPVTRRSTAGGGEDGAEPTEDQAFDAFLAEREVSDDDRLALADMRSRIREEVGV